MPKTLIFAKDDSHADDIVRIVREEFGRGNDFAVKITYRTTGKKPEELLAEFRTSTMLERRILPRYEPTEAWLAYIAHHIASKKVPIWVHGLETERVLDHYEWHEVGPDHLFHAATYEMIARQAPHGMVTPLVGLITTRRGKALEGRTRAGARPFETPTQGGPASLVGFRRGTR